MPKAQVFAVRFSDGEEIQIRDFPVDELTRIARKNNTSWLAVMDTPALDLSVTRDVIDTAARLLDVDPPSMGNGRELMSIASSVLVLVDDDVPDLPAPSGDGEANPTNASSTSS